MKIDINELVRRFNDEYTELYDREDGGAGAEGYADAVITFDGLNKAHFPLIAEFCRATGDFIASDREAAAFVFALNKMRILFSEV